MKLDAFVGAGEIDPQGASVREEYTDTRAETRLQVRQIELRRVWENLPGVSEQHEVHVVPDFPAILQVEQEVSGVSIAILGKPSERLGAAYGFHEVDRDFAAGVRDRMGGSEAKREHTVAIAQRHVRLYLCDDPREVERVRVATRIPFGVDGQRDTGGPEFTVTQLQRDVAAVGEEFGLFERARKVACAEAFAKCRRLGPWAKVAIEEASSRAELEHRVRIDRQADGHAAALEAKAGEVLDGGSLPRPKKRTACRSR